MNFFDIITTGLYGQLIKKPRYLLGKYFLKLISFNKFSTSNISQKRELFIEFVGFLWYLAIIYCIVVLLSK